MLVLRRCLLVFTALSFSSCIFLSSLTFAQEGTFVLTGSMSGPVYFHTATLLQNGQVLVAGGSGLGQGYNVSGQAGAAAALYDPTTGTFTATGSMTVARIGHSATLLNNGQVLIAGGGEDRNTGSPLASAELYNPATGTFTSTGSMNTARVNHTATLLNNGMVLVAGGGFGTVVASAELYDPATATFTPTGTMTTARTWQTATLLNNGQVLIAGGYDGSTALSSAELYAPTTGTFTATGSMANARTGQTATLLGNGQVLIAGGSLFPSLQVLTTTLLAGAELYDRVTGTFTAAGSMATARSGHTGTLLNSGQVLVTGGEVLFPEGPTSYFVSGNAAELYNPAAGTFTLTGIMNTARFGHTATLLNDGSVIVAGGEIVTAQSTYGEALASAELYEEVAVSPASLSFAS